MENETNKINKLKMPSQPVDKDWNKAQDEQYKKATLPKIEQYIEIYQQEEGEPDNESMSAVIELDKSTLDEIYKLHEGGKTPVQIHDILSGEIDIEEIEVEENVEIKENKFIENHINSIGTHSLYTTDDVAICQFKSNSTAITRTEAICLALYLIKEQRIIDKESVSNEDILSEIKHWSKYILNK